MCTMKTYRFRPYKDIPTLQVSLAHNNKSKKYENIMKTIQCPCSSYHLLHVLFPYG